MKLVYRKIFVLLSVLFMSFMVGFYGSRLVYFYNKEHKKTINKEITLNEKITASDKLLNNKDTMVKDDDLYYFYGKNPDNYLYYSGLMYRILYVEDGVIYAITDEVVTNLKFGNTSSFKESNVNEWLNKSIDNTGIFMNNLDKSNLYLKEDKATLLDKETFIKIGADKSFVVKDDFWILDNDEALVVTKEGNLTKTTNYGDFLGVKPVIKIKGTTKYITGDGSVDSPYILEKRNVTTLSDLYVGDYLKYKNLDLRVIEKNDISVKVVVTNPLKDKHIFSYSSNLFKTNYSYYDLGYYLNNAFIKNLNKKDLVETNFYIGDYGLDYKNTYKKNIKTYIGLLKIGDYFITSVPNSYLSTHSDQLIYTINKDKMLYADEITNKLNIYPVFNLNNALNIKGGNGSIKNPYVVG